jgi:hypothetical protein
MLRSICDICESQVDVGDADSSGKEVHLGRLSDRYLLIVTTAP